jgi:hypothetical protein
MSTGPVTDSEKLRLLCEAGYDPNEAHPECYRGFSYVKFFELCGGHAQGQQEPVAWRWCFEGTASWNYCKSKPKCAGAHDIVCEPLFAESPDTSTVCTTSNSDGSLASGMQMPATEGAITQRPAHPMDTISGGPVGPSDSSVPNTECICQDQHRRGYCTEIGCPYSLYDRGGK